MTLRTDLLPGAPAWTREAVSGDALMQQGLPVELTGDQSVAVVTITRR